MVDRGPQRQGRGLVATGGRSRKSSCRRSEAANDRHGRQPLRHLQQQDPAGVRRHRPGQGRVCWACPDSQRLRAPCRPILGVQLRQRLQLSWATPIQVQAQADAPVSARTSRPGRPAADPLGQVRRRWCPWARGPKSQAHSPAPTGCCATTSIPAAEIQGERGPGQILGRGAEGDAGQVAQTACCPPGFTWEWTELAYPAAGRRATPRDPSCS